MDRKSDELILQGLRQGDCKAFDELYMRYAPRVEAFACCMLKSRSEAEDLAHDIFLKIWENADRSDTSVRWEITCPNDQERRFRPVRAQVGAGTLRTAVPCCRRFPVGRRRCENRLRGSVDDRRTAVERMPEQRQRVFRLSRYERLSHQEIARELGITTKRWNTTSARRSPNCGRSSPRSSYSSDIPIFYAADPEQRWRSLLFFLRKTVPNGLGMPLVFPSYI